MRARQPNDRFWESKTLEQLDAHEWESLCDGCARCCLVKLEDVDTHEFHYTDVVCRYLETRTCRCTCYASRSERVPDCVRLRPDNLHELEWMPESCAYRLLYEGKPLPEWHPLISGDPNSVHAAGVSVRGRCISEEFVHTEDIVERVIHWAKRMPE
jgi:uncharacterized protein